MIKCCGFGVWSNVNSWTPTLVSGYFTGNESIVGLDKQVICLVVCNQAFVATSTGWGTASSITGSTSAATATVTAINLKSYNISDKLFGVVILGRMWLGL
jgi:hypothetical protein